MEHIKKNKSEINLKDFCIRVLLRWRAVLTTSIIVAILGCLLVVYNGWQYETSMPNMVSDVEESISWTKNGDVTEESISEYLNEQDLREIEITNINNALSLVEGYYEVYDANLEYLENSEFMKSDTIYITEIKLTVNATDNITKENIFEVYKSLVKSNQDYKYLSESLNLNLNLKYIEELIQVGEKSYDSSENYFLNIYVYNSDEEMSDSIANTVVEWLNTNLDKVKETFGEHELVAIGHSTYGEVNSKYLDYKQAVYNNLNNSAAQIENIQTNLSDNELTHFTIIFDKMYNENGPNTANEETEISVAQYNYIMNFAKYGILGLVLGMLISGSMVCLKVLYKDKLESQMELINIYGLNVFGGILCNELKHKNPIDKALYRLSNKSNMIMCDKNDMEILAVAIRLFSNKNNYNNILLIGKMNNKVEKCMCELKERLNNEGLIANVTSSIVEVRESLRMLEYADGVILVETIGETFFSEIEKEIYVLNVQNVNIMGAIVVH